MSDKGTNLAASVAARLLNRAKQSGTGIGHAPQTIRVPQDASVISRAVHRPGGE